MDFSPLAVSSRHEQIYDPTLAVGILDRLVRKAHGIELKVDLMRRNPDKANS